MSEWKGLMTVEQISIQLAADFRYLYHTIGSRMWLDNLTDDQVYRIATDLLPYYLEELDIRLERMNKADKQDFISKPSLKNRCRGEY